MASVIASGIAASVLIRLSRRRNEGVEKLSFDTELGVNETRLALPSLLPRRTFSGVTNVSRRNLLLVDKGVRE